MKKKSIVLVLILFIASAGIGTGFSLAVNAFQTNGAIRYIYGVNFTAVSYSDNEMDKEVADGKEALACPSSFRSSPETERVESFREGGQE